MPTPMISPRPALAIGRAVLMAVILGMGPAIAQTAGTVPPVKLVELIGKQYPIGQVTDALEAPGVGAASVMRLRPGVEVDVVGIVEGTQWYQIRLPDQRIAYVPTWAVPAAASTAADASAPGVSPAPAYAAAAPPPQAPAYYPATAAPPPPPTYAAAPPPPAPTYSAASAQPMPVPVDNGPAIDLPPVVEFADASDVLAVLNPTVVYLAPNPHAPTAYAVKSGTIVQVIAKSTDGQWAWVNTADSQPAYIPLADLAPPG
jgi:hypothetical protein